MEEPEKALKANKQSATNLFPQNLQISQQFILFKFHRVHSGRLKGGFLKEKMPDLVIAIGEVSNRGHFPLQSDVDSPSSTVFLNSFKCH